MSESDLRPGSERREAGIPRSTERSPSGPARSAESGRSGSFTSIRPELLGWRFVEMADGRAVMEWTPGPDLANPAGLVHGGWVGLIVDDVSGAALVSLLTEPRPFPTISMFIEYLRPIPIGATLTVTGVVVRAGKRVSVCDATIADAEKRLLARASTTFSVDFDGELRANGAPVAGFTALD